MPIEPVVTSNYGFPRQVPGQASRTAWNAALDEIDTTFAALAGIIDNIDLQQLQIKRLPPFVASDGLTRVQVPQYVMGQGNLIVWRGTGKMAAGIHFTEFDDTHFDFVDPCFAGEVVEAWVLQRGPDGGVPPVLPPASDTLFAVTEVPAGAIDSTDGINGNGTFTVSHVIAANTVPSVLVDGSIELTPTLHFTWSGNQVFVNPGAKPIVGETISITYQWRF